MKTDNIITGNICIAMVPTSHFQLEKFKCFWLALEMMMGKILAVQQG
jgi:hypothetical protein